MMQAPAHPLPEKGAECGERPAPEGATECGRPGPVPGRGRPCALSPRPGPATPGRGCVWLRSLRRAPLTPLALRLGLEVAPNAARRAACGASQVRAAAFPLRPPLRCPEEPGRAGGPWARAEARGWKTGARGTLLQLRSVAETFQTGAGCGPAVGEARRCPELHSRCPLHSRGPLRESTVSTDWWGGLLSGARGWGEQVSVA